MMTRSQALALLRTALTHLNLARISLANLGEQASADRLLLHIKALSLHFELSDLQISTPPTPSASNQGWKDHLALALRYATQSARGQVWSEDVRELRRESELIFALEREEPEPRERRRVIWTSLARWREICNLQ